ncbi:MAG: class I SAM-dependent RNA methyltransferase [Gemmatimonadota bacterium]
MRIEIESIAAGGEGVGRLPDGRAVFVHRTAPGESVEAQVTYERQRWARGRLLQVVTPSPERRAAPCPHYDECGGCTTEHLHYDAQLRVKSRIVADALARIGGLDVDAPAIVPSPREHRYRNRVSFALRRGGHGRVHAGFHALHDTGRIVPVDGTCLLPEEPIGAVWDRLRSGWGRDARRLPAGERLRLTLRATSAGDVSLVVEGGHSRGEPEELLERVEGLASIWYAPESGTSVLVAGAPGLPETWGEERFLLGGAAFLQINRSAAALLEDHVLALAGEVGGLRVVDAYCGIGLHARRLARAGAAVVGIELDPDAVRITAAALPESSFLEGRVEDRLPEALPADLLILNPPRAGVDAAVVEAIARSPAQRIIYISCDPATLARDLKRLGDLYHVTDIRCFDLFPQTAHTETVVQLTRR